MNPSPRRYVEMKIRSAFEMSLRLGGKSPCSGRAQRADGEAGGVETGLSEPLTKRGARERGRLPSLACLHLGPRLPNPPRARLRRRRGQTACACRLKHRLNPGRGTQGKIGEAGSKKAGGSGVKAPSNPVVKYLLAAVLHGHRLLPAGVPYELHPPAGLLISGFPSVKWGSFQ